MRKLFLARRLDRRRSLLLAVLLLPGLLGVPSFTGKALAAPPPELRPLPSSSPPLRLPELSIPSGEGALAVPHDWSKPRPERIKQRKAASPGRELVNRRDRTTEVFDNEDGTETIRLHAGPIHYQPPGSKRWSRIDNSIVADGKRPGWLRNAGNAWTAWFAPIEAGGKGGVTIQSADGTGRWMPDLPKLAAPIKPVAGKGEFANTVVYENVWPGVNVRYTVVNDRMTQDVIVTGRGAAELPFVTSGLRLGRTAVPKAASIGKVARGQIIKLNAAHESTVVTQSALIGPASACTYGTDGEIWCDGVSTGTNRWWWDPQPHWWMRSVARFDYRPHVESKQLIKATLWLGQTNATSGSTTDDELINVWDATSHDFGGAVAHGAPLAWIADGNAHPGGCYWGIDVCFDVTDKVESWQYNGVFNGFWDDGSFGFSPDEADLAGPDGILDRNSYKNYDTAQVALDLNVNIRPTAPQLDRPLDGSLAIETLTPTLRWKAASDGDGEALKYIAKIATNPDGETGAVATSPEGTALEWKCHRVCCGTVSPITGRSLPPTPRPGRRRPPVGSPSIADSEPADPHRSTRSAVS